MSGQHRVLAAIIAFAGLSAWSPLPDVIETIGAVPPPQASDQTTSRLNAVADEMRTGQTAGSPVPSETPSDAAMAAIFETSAGAWTAQGQVRNPGEQTWSTVDATFACAAPEALTLRCTGTYGGVPYVSVSRYENGVIIVSENQGTERERTTTETITGFGFETRDNWWIETAWSVVTTDGRVVNLRNRRFHARSFDVTYTMAKPDNAALPYSLYLHSMASRARPQ